VLNCYLDGPPPAPHASFSDWFREEGSKGILVGLRISALSSRAGSTLPTPSRPTPEAAPVATDEELTQAWNDHQPAGVALRAVYELGRQHGAAQPPAAQPVPPAAPAGGLVERVVELREKFEQLIKCSRAYDGYSTMTPVELADRLIDAVLELEADR